MESGTILFEQTLPSIVHKNEIAAELGKVVAAAGYPVGKVRWVEALEAYAGFADTYFARAKQLPPIPGGWRVWVKAFTPEARTFMVNLQKRRHADGTETYQINPLILKMFDEYRKEGLDVEVSDELELIYGVTACKVQAQGHPFLLDVMEDFIENMR